MSTDTSTLTISLGQFDVVWGNPDHNMAIVREWIAEAARRGSDLLVLPELWDTGYALDRTNELATGTNEGRFAEVGRLAAEHGLYIIGSMLELGHPQGTSRPAYNTAVWFTPDGTALGSYRKVHLFRGFEEDRYLLPGGMPNWVNLPWGMAGVGICYDLRFPELFRSYALSGVTLTVVPAQWPHPRLYHWQTLLRARAIENQMIMVACNRVGRSGDVEFCGHSAIYDAWGNAVVEADEEEDLITAIVDVSEVERVRSLLPVFEDRRPDFYGQ